MVQSVRKHRFSFSLNMFYREKEYIDNINIDIKINDALLSLHLLKQLR